MKWQEFGQLILTLLLLAQLTACGGTSRPRPGGDRGGAGGGALCPPAVSGGQCDRA